MSQLTLDVTLGSIFQNEDLLILYRASYKMPPSLAITSKKSFWNRLNTTVRVPRVQVFKRALGRTRIWSLGYHRKMEMRTSVGARSTWVLRWETVTQYSYFDDNRAVTEGADLPICCHVSPFPRSAPRACASDPSRRLRKLPPSTVITEIHCDLVNDCHTFNFTIRISVVTRSTSVSHDAGNRSEVSVAF